MFFHVCDVNMIISPWKFGVETNFSFQKPERLWTKFMLVLALDESYEKKGSPKSVQILPSKNQAVSAGKNPYKVYKILRKT